MPPRDCLVQPARQLPLNRITGYNNHVVTTLTEIEEVLQTEKPYLADKQSLSRTGGIPILCVR